jgi:hypothetical protein
MKSAIELFLPGDRHHVLRLVIVERLQHEVVKAGGSAGRRGREAAPASAGWGWALVIGFEIDSI